MPNITRTFFDLFPNIADTNENRISNWFSYIKNVYSPRYGSTITPPTKLQFMTEWRRISNSNNPLVFHCNGDNVIDLKSHLKCYSSICTFQGIPTRYDSIDQNTINKAWVRIIAAFNMYADICQVVGYRKCNRIDFIGSAGNNDPHANIWIPKFNNRCVLFLSDDAINYLIARIIRYDHINFWFTIFDIYNTQIFNPRFSSNSRPLIQNNPTPHSASNSIRLNSQKNPINNEIIEIINNMETPLPKNIRKFIYDACIASYISHPID